MPTKIRPNYPPINLQLIHLDRASAVPLYKQLLNEVIAQIASGTWAPGTQLPTEAELMAAFDISRVTIRQAFDALAETEQIVRVPGKGTYIATVEPAKRSQGYIGYVVPHLSHSFNVQILLGAESVFKAAGFQTIFCSTDADLGQENRLLENLEQEGMAGYAIQPLVGGDPYRTLRHLIAKHVPVVLIDRFGPELEADAATSDNFGGERAAVQHLIDQGYTRISFLARPPLALSSINERYQAYQYTLREAGLDVLPPIIVGNERELGSLSNLSAFLDHQADTIDMIKGYLQATDRPQAIVAMNDLHALLTVEAARRAMLNVPEDLAVVGFDDLDFASAVTPPLTTVAQQPFLMGSEAANLLLSRIGGDTSPVKRLRVPTRLVVRGSSQRSRR